MIQDINEQFIQPEFTEGQDLPLGPAEESLYQLDGIGKTKINTDEQDDSFMLDRQAKDVLKTLSPIPKEPKLTSYMDDKGNLYDEDSPAFRDTALQETLPDPPTEEQKKQKKEELMNLMDEDLKKLEIETDELIQLGGLTESRREKYIERRKGLIQQDYNQQYEDFTKGIFKEYLGKNKTEKQINATLSVVNKQLEKKLMDVDKAVQGYDLSKVSTFDKDDTNPELEQKYQETLKMGISTYEQFSDAFQKGKLPEGSVIRIFDDRGYKSNVMTPYAKPVYYQAFTTETGEKRIDKIADGGVNPLTGQTFAIAPISNMSAITLNPTYDAIINYDQRLSDINTRTDISEQEKEVKRKNLKDANKNGLSNLNTAYDEIISPNSKYSKNVKLAVLASTFPNQFKQKYAELSAQYKTEQEVSDRVLEAFGGIAVSPITGVTLAAGAAEKGVTAFSRFVQGKPEGVLPTGVLALEIEKNPELAKAIDDTIVEAGSMAGKYLNSVEGIANLVSAAKAKLNNKDIESLMVQGRAVFETIQQAFGELSTSAKKLNLDASNYEAGVLRILNKSGYNSLLRDYNNAVNELKNSDDENVRNAFKYIRLQSDMLEEGTVFSEKYSAAKPEDIEFINKVGKEFNLNPTKNKIIQTVYDKVENIRQLAERARNAFPSEELNQYEANNRPALDAAINNYKQQEQMFRNSEVFSEKGRFILSRLNQIDDEYNSAFSDTRMFSFPMLTQDVAQMKNALAYINPAYGLGVGVLNGIGDILSGLKETGQKLSGFSWDGFDANSRNISYSLNEYKRYLDSQGETGNYAFDISKSIGEAFPQMVGFAGSFIAGGPIGGASYLAATMTGPKMREGAAAGLNPMGQATYAVLSMGIEYGSELVTSEAALFRGVRGKSVLTKELVEKIMSPKTRKEAFNEYANMLWKKGAKTTWQGTLEAFEEEVANKGNYLLQSFYNGMMNTSFNPNIGTAQESLDTLITMIGTSALFKGVGRLKQMAAGATPMQEAKKQLQKQGMDKVSASIMATLTTSEGMARALDIVKKVESGQIKESELNLPVYENVRDVLIPAAMSLNFSPNLSIQQRTVAMDNMVKADELTQMVERGEVAAEEAAPALQTYAQNAQKALRDVEYANTEFGINADEMKSMIYDFFGVADMASGKTGALDARTEEEMAQAPVTQADMTPLDRQGFINSLNEIYVTPETNNAVKTAAQAAIAKNPESFIAGEIQNTKNLIEKAKSDYELASKQGPASAELALIDNLSDKLNDLETIKSRYLKSQGNATQISQGQQQEIGQPSGVVQRQGVEQGQPQIGQTEGGIGQATQQTADTRNRNFSSQARQANQEVRQIFADTGVTGAYTMPIQEGQEVQFMDSLASQVAIDEPSVVSQLGQPVVDRVKKYMAETNFTSELPVIRTAQEAEQQRKVEESRNILAEALRNTDSAPVAANKRAVKSLVDRLKKAFPNVKVVMDKKGFKDALKDEAARDLMAKGGIVYGRVLDGVVYLNPDFANYNTPIHEFGHLWLSAAKEVAPKLYEKGLQLIRDSEYMAKLQGDPLYDNLSNEELENEALATAIGDRGEQFVNDAQKDGFRNWMRRMLKKMAQYVGIFNLSNTEIDMLTLDEYLNRATASILAGEEISPASVRASGFQSRLDDATKLGRITGGLTYNDAIDSFKSIISSDEKIQISSYELDQEVDNIVNGLIIPSLKDKRDTQKVTNIQGLANAIYEGAIENWNEIRDESISSNEYESAMAAIRFGKQIKDSPDSFADELKALAYGLKMPGWVRDRFTGMSPFEDGFMARMSGVNKQMTDLANNVMQRELGKGRTLEEAKAIATSEVSSTILANATGKTDINKIVAQIDSIVDKAYQEQKRIQQANARQQRINQAFTTPQAQKIVRDANQMASDIAAANVGSKTKVGFKQAYEQVLAKVKADIQKMYDSGVIPANVSWIDMMSLAPGIATDAVSASFPARQRAEAPDVNMTTSQFIRNAVSNQIRAIRDVKDRTKKIEKAVKDILKSMSDRYGRGLKLSAAEVKAIIKDINDNVFSREDIMNAVDNAATEISKVIEKGYRRKLLQDTASLIDRLKSAAKTKFSGDFFVQVSKITDTDLSVLPSSTATLEDISKLNENISRILSGKLEGIQDALSILNNIAPTNQQIVANEHKSLLTKIKDLIDRANNNTLSNLDYQTLLNLQKAVEDVKDRKGNIAALTPEQQVEIMQQYGVLMLTQLGNINNIVANKEAEIKRETVNLIQKAKSDVEDATSDIRDKIPNVIMYQQFLRFLNALTDNYVSNLSPKELLNLSNALNSVMTYGNYSNVTYSEYVKAKRYKLKTEGREWGVGISARRNKINSTGLTGFVTSKFKNFVRTFTDVEGATPSPDRIAKNLDLLKLTALDYELYSGFDELNMGFLEREVFGPMAMAIDAAATKTQAKLGELQSAMLSFADSSNDAVVKKAIGEILRTYNLSGTVLGMSLAAKFKKGYKGALVADISTRMAAIVAHQIDHISNLEQGEQAIDMVLQRNILESKTVGKTMYEFFSGGGQSFSSLSTDYNKYLDAIAYAALTNAGRTTLADMNSDELMNLLTDKQKEGITLWRQHIANNTDLFEAAQIVTGNMKSSIKNYFPRRVMSGNNIESIQDAQNYINSQSENLGLNQAQLQSRSANVGRLDLDGNRVLLNNMKALNLMNEVQPYLDYIKGLEDAINDIKENPAGANEFAVAYLEGISMAAKNRLNASLMSNEKAISDTFGAAYKAITAVQGLASRVWLISVSRQIIDFGANIASLSAGLAFENKKFGNQIMRIFNPRSAKYKTDKGIYKWDDYVDIARFTGSPIYKVMSIYADNILYEYKKTPEELQRQQRVGSWQDMAVKKRGWMSRFEEAFKKITGEYLDHAEFKNERGVYHAMNLAAVEKAAAAADSFTDRKFSLPSFTRQPISKQILFPLIGRGLSNLRKENKRVFTMSRDNPAALITGFLQGYPTTQHQAFNSYMKLAFSTTSGLPLAERAKYFSRAIIEGVLPVFMYTVSRTYMATIFMASARAIMEASDDEEEMKKAFKELDKKEGWEKFLYKNKKAMESVNDSAIEYILNGFTSVAVDPQTNFLLRTSLGLTVFAYWKHKAYTELDKLTNKKDVRRKKMEIRKFENGLFKMFNMRPFVLYGTEDYDRAMLMHYERYKPGKATEDWEMLVNSIGGISVLYDVINTTAKTVNLMDAAEGKTEIDKNNAMLGAGLQAYGLLFSNMMLGGKLGLLTNMISGDANKLGKYFMAEEMSKYREEKREKEGFLIEVGKGKKQKKRAGAPGGRGGKGRAGVPKGR